ncbi:hypothetical protein BWI97_12985 [Siphonobacter sp. BAB-5405]|uniref:hypothetical protein n=1 Tax=Siphonobacter sp. BAB-5405 TaxID=1864825 RepID=UPI000C80BBE9|nr:hypothetical protein [Siphonobacter sp. BAB-5405]PMD96202.1 hypothetical protein BWI97_12985 [Siphonobacter sp. BAB-5405]
MKPKQLLRTACFLAALFTSSTLMAQVKIGDNPTVINAGSALEVESTNKGLLMPRISLTSTTTWGLLGTPAAGMHVYNTNTGITAGSAAYPALAAKIGEYYWDGNGWVGLAPAQRNTVVTSWPQTAGVTLNVPANLAANSCPTCNVDINQTGTFSITNPTSDVVIDVVNFSSVSNHNANVVMTYLIQVDKTTPGTFERIGFYSLPFQGTACSGLSTNAKFVLKNLPVRAQPYTVRILANATYNGGSNQANFGVGSLSATGCGGATTDGNSTIISVTQ